MPSGAWANNLPKPLSSFVGRAREREEASSALAGTRLLVLTGAGGCGKTRLATEVAASVEERFPDGAWWLDLAPLSDADQVPGVLAGVLGVRPLPGRTETQAAVGHLATDRAMVVLDNCEHVLAKAADLSEALLRGCPNVTVLATSRTPLGVPGERDWRVPSLSLPGTDEAEEVARSDASGLFAERAAQVDPRFEVTGRNAGVVRRICQTLDGLPLAIELAAARVRMLSLEQIADGLADPFRLLTGGRGRTVPRHQTLRASVDWSYALLSEDERVLFRRLAVFAGSWSLEAVEAVGSGDGLGPDEVLDLLASLVDESLVVVDHHDRQARYRLLETVRQYALERLAVSGELLALRDRHLAFYRELSDRAEQELHTPQSRRWIDQLQLERSNVQTAIDHALDSRPDDALRISVDLAAWWRFAGQFAVGRRALIRALEATPAMSPLRPRALWSVGFLAYFSGDRETTIRYLQEALHTAPAVGDDWTAAIAFILLSAAKMFRDPVGSRADFEGTLARARAVGDPWVLMMALAHLGRSHAISDNVAEVDRWFTEAARTFEQVGVETLTQSGYGLGWSAMLRCQFDRSAEFYRQAWSAARELGDPITEALVERMLTWTDLMRGRHQQALERIRASEVQALAMGAFLAIPGARTEMGRALAALGQLDEARELLEVVVAGGADGGWHYCAALLALADVLRALGDTDGSAARAGAAQEVAERVGSRSYRAAAREILARLAMGQGAWGDADALLHEALALRVEIGVPIFLPQTLEALGQVACGLESHGEAARLLGAAEQARADLGLARWPLDEAAATEMEHTLGEQLGAEGFAKARAEGAAMALDDAVKWARRARGERKRPSHGWESLTPTERQVVELVARGLSNAEVARRMFISSGTAKVHLAHIFQKVDVHSRAELVALALRQSP